MLCIFTRSNIPIYENNERMTKGIAVTYINQIRKIYNSECGFDFVVKTAFSDDVEEFIIDYWSLPGGDGFQKSETSPKKSNDVIDDLTNKFSELVEITDGSEFLDYNPEDESFEQSTFDEDDREEFFTDEETSFMSDEE